MPSTFLTAEWRKLAIANYAIESSILKRYLPAKTELDFWNSQCYVSLVGFMFLNTRLKGFRIPFHTSFEEVNLRFYVKYKCDKTGWKRGVVFIKEIVPKPMLTFVANAVYKEKYQTMPMEHQWEQTKDSLQVSYKWKLNEWNSFSVEASEKSEEIVNGSEEEFITEHYWGYTKINSQVTSEYEVLHPRWNVYPVKKFDIQVDFEKVYGKDFSFLRRETPLSVFLAEGSEIEVRQGLKI